MISDDDYVLFNIFLFGKLIISMLVIVLACIYLLPLCILSRFHSSINILTIHLCFTLINLTSFWIVIYIFNFTEYFDQSCSVVNSIEILLNCSVIYSLCSLSINRVLNIIYSTKLLFKSKKWPFICIVLTWIITLLASLLILIPVNTQVK